MMRYDLLITEIKNESSRKILAHQLARDPGVSFQDALEKLKKLPVILFSDLEEQAMVQQVAQYLKYGVRLKAVPAQQPQKATQVTQNAALSEKKPAATPEYIPASTKKIIAVTRSVDLVQQADSTNGTPGKTSIDRIQKKEEKKRKAEQVMLLSFMVVFLVIPLLLYFSSSGKNTIRKISIPGASGVQDAKHGDEDVTESSNATVQPSQSSQTLKRKSVTSADKKTSAEMCDSAKRAGIDNAKMINFYKIAISFNKYNLDAWFGLLAAYKSAGMSDEYQLATLQMKELFGDDVLEISSHVKRFGDVGDMYISDAGVLTMNVNLENMTVNVLEDKVYPMIKILRSNYNYESISVVAGDNRKDRMVVHIRPGMEIATFADFKKNASIMIFEK